ncbi:universal stress protein [Haloarcula amylovorans]|uniref:universal stress protein n=1 Tax=Haloarcula amylovorans TaxID=2562280 RepID=UPI0010769DAF|nr:universal stress protein [Halomicroarcula amylolytica]
MPILAAIDDSERAATVLDEAHELAADLGTDVHALHVVKRSELVSLVETDVEQQNPAENYEVQEAGRDLVERVTDETTAAKTTVTVRVGDPAEEIADHADEIDARYVVVGGRKRSPTGKALFGSVTQKVLFDSPVPVLNVLFE